MARDNYMGFQIDYSGKRDGYRIMVEDEIVHEAHSYDAACEWIERQAPRRKSKPVYLD